MKRTLSILSMSFVLMASLISPLAMASTPVAPNLGEPVVNQGALDQIRSDLCADRLPYRDVDQDDWFHDSTCSLLKKGAIDSDRYFNPHNNATRMEFMKMALIMGGYRIDDVSGTTFKDMDQSHWAWEVASTAHKLGFMNGYDGYLRPNDPITRGEALVVVMRMHDKELWGWNEGDIHFRDVDSDDFYAYATIIGYRKGIISGYGDRTFRGENNVSRGEVTQMLTKSEQVWPNQDF